MLLEWLEECCDRFIALYEGEKPTTVNVDPSLYNSIRIELTSKVLKNDASLLASIGTPAYVKFKHCEISVVPTPGFTNGQIRVYQKDSGSNYKETKRLRVEDWYWNGMERARFKARITR